MILPDYVQFFSASFVISSFVISAFDLRYPMRLKLA